MGFLIGVHFMPHQLSEHFVWVEHYVLVGLASRPQTSIRQSDVSIYLTADFLFFCSLWRLAAGGIRLFLQCDRGYRCYTGHI